jgi:hypothetical protein
MAFDYYDTRRCCRVSLKELLCLQGFDPRTLDCQDISARQLAGMVWSLKLITLPAFLMIPYYYLCQDKCSELLLISSFNLSKQWFNINNNAILISI